MAFQNEIFFPPPADIWIDIYKTCKTAQLRMIYSYLLSVA